jgi:hypothetical protein
LFEVDGPRSQALDPIRDERAPGEERFPLAPSALERGLFHGGLFLLGLSFLFSLDDRFRLVVFALEPREFGSGVLLMARSGPGEALLEPRDVDPEDMRPRSEPAGRLERLRDPTLRETEALRFDIVVSASDSRRVRRQRPTKNS